MKSAKQKSIDTCGENLLHWFDKNKEDFFFRTHKDPYITWVSEIALQQTRINAALSKLQNFLHRFSTLQSLAQATEEEVVSAFAGLGYYNRARNLHRGAIFIHTHYDGRFPDTLPELMQVAGIGSYTATAILSISFNQPLLAIDGNVKRIYQRLRRQALPAHLSPQHEFDMRSFFAPLFRPPAESKNNFHNGDVNEALMQLGQKICKVKNPLCHDCPLVACCLFSAHDEKNNFFILPKTQIKIPIRWRMYILFKEENSTHKIFLQNLEDFFFLRYGMGFASLLMPASSQENSFLSLVRRGQKTKSKLAHPLAEFLFALEGEQTKKNLSSKDVIFSHLGNFRHSITRYNIEAQVYACDSQKLKKNLLPAQREIFENLFSHADADFFLPQEANRIISSSLFHKALARFLDTLSPS